MKPNFICIGAQKGGTTSLIKYLNYHPKIYMKQGECHFFDRPLSDGPLTKQDIKKYENSFTTKKRIIGEKTPSYSYLKYAIDRIYNYDKNIKLIFLLREPISRAYSQYNMTLNFNDKTLDDVTEYEMMNTFINDNSLELGELHSKLLSHSYIQRGYYDEILTYILSKFSRKNIYIGISEEINKNKLKYYNEIYQFLGVKKLDRINENLNAHIRTYTKPMPKALEHYLYTIYKSHNKKLYKLLGRKIDIWEDYYNNLLGVDSVSTTKESIQQYKTNTNTTLPKSTLPKSTLPKSISFNSYVRPHRRYLLFGNRIM